VVAASVVAACPVGLAGVVSVAEGCPVGCPPAGSPALLQELVEGASPVALEECPPVVWAECLLAASAGCLPVAWAGCLPVVVAALVEFRGVALAAFLLGEFLVRPRARACLAFPVGVALVARRLVGFPGGARLRGEFLGGECLGAGFPGVASVAFPGGPQASPVVGSRSSRRARRSMAGGQRPAFREVSPVAEPVAGLASLPPGEGPEVCPVGFPGAFRAESQGVSLAVRPVEFPAVEFPAVEFPAVEFPVAGLRVGLPVELPVELPHQFLLVKT